MMRARSDISLSRLRWSGALAALAALTTLMAVGPPGNARAATGTGRRARLARAESSAWPPLCHSLSPPGERAG